MVPLILGNLLWVRKANKPGNKQLVPKATGDQARMRGFGQKSLGFRILGLGFRIWGLGFWICRLGFRIYRV